MEYLNYSYNYIITRKELILYLCSYTGHTATAVDIQLTRLVRLGFIKRIKMGEQVTNLPSSYQLTSRAIKYLRYLSKRSGYVSFVFGNPKVELRQKQYNRRFWRPERVRTYTGGNIPMPADETEN